MSGITTTSDANFTDISSKSTDRLVYNHPMLNTQAKAVSKIIHRIDDSLILYCP